MGYTLKIGQAVKRYDNERRMDQIDCEKVFLMEAPAFGELTDHTNVRMPSYSTWEIFAEEVGLYNFFFDKEMGLLNGADGVSPLTQAHKEVIDASCAAYVERYPFVFSVKAIDSLSEEDFHFERLRWLKFWTDWALTNCDAPIFLNEQ